MRIRVVALMMFVALSACSSQPGLPDQEPSGPDGLDVATQTEIAFEPIEVELPPPIVSGVFHPLTSDPIDQILFPEKDGLDIRIIGMLESDGLLYAYFSVDGSIYYAVSSDGVEWALSPDPVFTGLISEDFEYYPDSVGFTDQGYAIFLSSATINYADNDYLYSIWALLAPQPAGPWSLSQSPMLYGYPGENGIAFYVTDPIVRPYLEGYRMYHRLSFAIENIGTPDFAVAHSMNGLNWRYTRDLPREDIPDEPVVIARAVEDYLSGLNVLDIWPTTSGWQMLATMPDDEGDLPKLIFSEATDGLEWGPSEVVIELDQANPDRVIVAASVLYYQEKYYLAYCSSEPGSDETICFITTNNQ